MEVGPTKPSVGIRGVRTLGQSNGGRGKLARIAGLKYTVEEELARSVRHAMVRRREVRKRAAGAEVLGSEVSWRRVRTGRGEMVDVISERLGHERTCITLR